MIKRLTSGVFCERCQNFQGGKNVADVEKKSKDEEGEALIFVKQKSKFGFNVLMKFRSRRFEF